MKIFEIAFSATLLLFVVAIIGAGMFVYNYPLNVMRFPYFVGGFLLLMGLWRLKGAIQGERLDGEREADPTTESVGQFARTAAWLLAILPAVWILGYPAGISLYLLVYFLVHGQGWLTSIILSLAALAVTYFVFIVFLRVNLPLWPIGLAP
ncbi:MAG: tripartite tricarboxylate transporter TctB family protein [Alphaproteobacteria bacterium]|nr:tripartite tricarboxylate transporter TctB family protein [Alphaproteobacteria bacterium]